MQDYIIEEAKLEITQKGQPKLICHQIYDGEKKSDLHDMQFEAIKIYNIDSLDGISFITENNINIDLSKYCQQATKKEKNIILDLDNIEEFKCINIPNWFELKSDTHTDLKGLVSVRLRYLKPASITA
jgi:hypothetical protein